MFGPRHTFASALRTIVEGLERGDIVLSQEQKEDPPLAPAELKMELTLVPNANAETIFEKVVGLIGLLDRYDRAGGGTGIHLDTVRSRSAPGAVTLVLTADDWGERPSVLKAEVATISGVSGVRVDARAG